MNITLTPAELEDILDSLDDRIERVELQAAEVDYPDPYFEETLSDLRSIRDMLLTKREGEPS